MLYFFVRFVPRRQYYRLRASHAATNLTLVVHDCSFLHKPPSLKLFRSGSQSFAGAEVGLPMHSWIFAKLSLSVCGVSGLWGEG